MIMRIAGHGVVGPARSDAPAAALDAKGTHVLRGDPESLGRGATDADLVVHLAEHDPAEADEVGVVGGSATTTTASAATTRDLPGRKPPDPARSPTSPPVPAPADPRSTPGPRGGHR